MTGKSKQQVFTLLVQVGRSPEDGLPAKASGAALMCYASGVDEAEAVRETVAILKKADLAPLDVPDQMTVFIALFCMFGTKVGAIKTANGIE